MIEVLNQRTLQDILQLSKAYNMRIFLPSLRRAGAFLLREVRAAISTKNTLESDAENTKSFSKCDKSLTKTPKDHDGMKKVTTSKRTRSFLSHCD